MLWMSSGTESTVELPPRRDNHSPTTGTSHTERRRHSDPNKAHRSNISYIIVIHFAFI